MVWYVNFLAAVSFATNFATFIYTRKTFNIKQSIYYVLTLDSALACMGNLSILMVSLLKMMFEDNLEIPCYLLALSQLIVIFSFPSLNFLTACIRLKTIESSLKNKPWYSNSKQIGIINVVVVSCVIYSIIIVLLEVIGGFKMFPIVAGCMDESLPKYHLMFFVFCILPQIIILVITLAIDIKATYVIQEFRNGQISTSIESINRTLFEETPMRATIINGCSILVFGFIYVFVASISWQDLQSVVSIVLSLALTFQAFKSPLIVLWTFRVYQENMNIERNVDREERRQLEIKEAKKRKLEIALRKFSMEIPQKGIYFVFNY